MDTYTVPTDPTVEWAAELAAAVGLEEHWPDGGAGLSAFIMGSTAESRSLLGRMKAAIVGGLFGATSQDYAAGWLALAAYTREYYPENVFHNAGRLAATYAAAGGAEAAYSNPANRSTFAKWVADTAADTTDKLTDWKTMGILGALALAGAVFLSRK